MQRVSVKPELLEWAAARAGNTAGDLYAKIPNLNRWIQGEKLPTLKQLEDFAKAAHVSVGYLFLSEPPDEKLPIPDMRTVGGQRLRKPSPDLLDTIYACQMRQDWYREYAKAAGFERVQFVGSATLSTPPDDAAAEMRKVIDYSVEVRAACQNWQAAVTLFVERIERAGVLVMVNGVVGNNTSRPLDSDEFRGFALADQYAPVIFVNSNDTKAARVFTMAHELAHLLLGESALSNAAMTSRQQNQTEQWCNRVAAEFLVPLADLSSVATDQPLNDLDDLSRLFKVSRLVIVRRLLDGRLISRSEFDATYPVLLGRYAEARAGGGGGDFYRTLTGRVSRRFAQALIGSTLEGGTLVREACQLLSVGNDKVLRDYGRRMGYTM